MQVRKMARHLNPLKWTPRVRKYASVGALGVVLAGNAVWISHNVLQRRLDRKTTIDFVFGEHSGWKATNTIAPLLEEAKRSGKPYKFMVMESSDTDRNGRKKWEADLNWVASQIKIRTNGESILRDLTKMQTSRTNLTEADRKNAIFNIEEIVLAAKYGLVLKVGEEYPKADIAKMSHEVTNALFQIHLSRPYSTPQQIRAEISANASKFQKYIDKRNAAIAKVTGNAAAEIRKDVPSLRDEELRGIMHLGSYHIGTDSIMLKKRPGMNITRTLHKNPNKSSLVSLSMEEIVFSGKRLDSKGSVDRLAIAGMLEIGYSNYLEHNMERAQELSRKILALEEIEAAKIMSRVRKMDWIDARVAIENMLLGTK